MNEIKRVAIFGAGAMGAYFSTCFFKTEGFDTALVAKGERLKRLMDEGIVVNGETYRIPVVDPGNGVNEFDLIIFALKHHHLVNVAGDLKNLVGNNTTIISVMNGLDSEGMIGAEYGEEKVLYTVSVGIDALREGNRVVYTRPGIHYFGEARNDTTSERVLKVQQAFDKAGIQYKTPPDMIRTMWWKLMINVGMNPVSAVMRAPFGVFQTSGEALNLMKRSMMEVIELAGAEGVDLTEKDLEDWLEVLKTLSPKGKTSMLQDIEAGYKTEVEIFCEKIVNLGIKHRIPTPVNQTLLSIIRVQERFPAGKT